MSGTLENRRHFLQSSAAVVTCGSVLGSEPIHAKTHREIQVIVWDERQPRQKQAYANFLGNAIADHLKTKPGLSVASVALDDPEHGLTDQILAHCDILIWWGHIRQAEVSPEVGKKIVARIKTGTLSLITLHSAHWSTPFVEAMNERARIDAEKLLKRTPGERVEIREIAPEPRYKAPLRDARITPWLSIKKMPTNVVQADLYLPICCFPSYRSDGKASQVRVLARDHPIAKGLPATFEIAQTEMYDEPFHVPEPDEIVFEERWADGSWFRSGMVWNLGKGRIFYFRPGHETYPVYKHEKPLLVLENAVRWLAGSANG